MLPTRPTPWRALSAAAGLPIFHRTGVLFLFQRDEPYARDSLAVHRALNLPIEALGDERQRVPLWHLYPYP